MHRTDVDRRDRRRGPSRAVAAALALALLGAACSDDKKSSSSTAPDASTGAAASGDLIVNDSTPPSSLDPGFTCNLEDLGLISDLYVTLVKYGTKGDGIKAVADPSKIEGYLAKDWKVSDDGLTYTFNLNDAKFPSGKPIDAEAVKYSYERANSPDGGGMGCGGYFAQAGQMPDGIVKDVKAVSPTQVEITLNRAEPLYIKALALPSNGILDPSVIEANGGIKGSKDYLGTHSASGGPYVIESYEPGSKLVLKANDTFFGDKPLRSKVTVNFIATPETLQLEAKNADITLGLPAAAIETMKKDSSVEVISTPRSEWQAVYLPTKTAPFDNVDFRQALSLAVPYKDIIDKIAFGAGQAFSGPYPPAFPAFNAKIGAARETSMDKAKEALKKSGVTGTTKIDLIFREGVPEAEELATVLQSAWKDLGVEVTPKKTAASAYAEAVSTPDKTFAIIRYDGPAVEDPAWLLDYDLPCASPYNVSNYCDSDLEAKLAAAHKETDDGKRQAIWDEIATSLAEATPRIPLYGISQTVVLKKDIKHFRSATGAYWFHAWG